MLCVAGEPGFVFTALSIAPVTVKLPVGAPPTSQTYTVTDLIFTLKTLFEIVFAALKKSVI
jgi:hypothetical protein